MAPSSTRSFNKGDEVEVTSDEDGFRGAWFAARVHSAAARSGRYVIVYDAIRDDADETKPLRELTDSSHIRPRPPRVVPPGGRFGVGQPVDAFDKDAWWSGTVSRVHEGEGEVGERRYGVRFDTGEECEYAQNELRLRMDWANGEWVMHDFESVQKVKFTKGTPVESEQKVEFTKGSLVEVSIDDEGFRGAWFGATVVELLGKRNFLVEYQQLKTDDETEPLKETVDIRHIRPPPPKTLKPQQFKLLEEVDTFYNDGWWAGVISKVLSGSKYTVYFRVWKQEMDFDHCDVRLHHEWINGEWFQISQALGQ